MGFFKSVGRIATGIASGGLTEVARAVAPKTSGFLDNVVGPGYLAGSAFMGTAGLAGLMGLGLPGSALATAGVNGATSAGSAGGIGGWMSANPLATAYLGSSLLGSFQSAQAARDANVANRDIANQSMAFSADQAKQQMAYQTLMSNTAYQRQAADMRAAGINPVVGFGSGASTPGGAMGSGATTSVEPVPSIVANMVTSARDGLNLVQGLRESDSRIMSNRASAGLAGMSAQEKEANAYKSELETKLLKTLVNTGKNAYNRIKISVPDSFEFNH